MSNRSATLKTDFFHQFSTLRQRYNVHMKEHVTLTQKEQTRLQVLNSLLAEHMTTEQAATLMRLSEHHTRQILATYRKE